MTGRRPHVSGEGAGLPAWRTEEHASLASTQQLVKERVAAGADADGLVVRALEQPAGRGRRGKEWSSLPGGSYQSFAVRDRWAGALRRPGVTLLLAASLAEELRAAGARATVKWPNDVYLGEGKLAGVLCEYYKGHLVVGIGVNVANPVPANAAALAGWELPFVHALVLEAARRALEDALGEAALGHAGGEGRVAAPLPDRLAALDHLKGKAVTVAVAAGAVTGVACGVDEDGALLLRDGEELLTVVDGTVTAWERSAAVSERAPARPRTRK